MLKHLRLSGCQVPEKNIFCAPCASPFASSTSGPSDLSSTPSNSTTSHSHAQNQSPAAVLHSGAYLPHPHGAIKLCAGHFFSKQHVESTIAHELIHMFDECRCVCDIHVFYFHCFVRNQISMSNLTCSNRLSISFLQFLFCSLTQRT